MPDSVTTVSESGFASTNHIGEHEVAIDSAEDVGPNPTATLLSAYASCFMVGLRIVAERRGLDDLGRIEIDVTGERDDAGDLDSIAFDLSFEAELAAEEADALVATALESCHVGTALRTDLEATVTLVND